MKRLILLALIIFFSFDVYSQDKIEGVWDCKDSNTLIEISKAGEEVVGKILSSDDPEAPIGELVFKDLSHNGEEWEGEIFAMRKKKWYKVKLIPEQESLKLKVYAGIFSKTFNWPRTE